PFTRELFVTDAIANELRVFGLDVDGDGVIDDPSTWTNRSVATSLITPTGIAFDDSSNTFIIVEMTNHCVRRVSPAGDVVDTVVGACGVAGSAPGFLNQPTHAIASDASGAVYVSDTGNNRVVRVAADGSVATVIGDGSSSSSGEGPPARQFPVDHPRQ